MSYSLSSQFYSAHLPQTKMFGNRKHILNVPCFFVICFILFMNVIIRAYSTVKPGNKGHPRERHHMVFVDKWSLFGGYLVLFYHGRVIEKIMVFLRRWPLIQV